jgi:hypothetical protein
MTFLPIAENGKKNPHGNQNKSDSAGQLFRERSYF